MDKFLRLSFFLTLISTVYGLFLPWAKLEFIDINGISSWVGMITLIVALAQVVIIFRNNSFPHILVTLLLPILSLIQFYNFRSALNIGSPSISFSKQVAEQGFFVTFFSGLFAVILNGIFYSIKKRRSNSVNQSV